MFYIRGKDRSPRNGFNFYPLSDPDYIGGRFRFFNRMYFFHYSKKLKKFKGTFFNLKDSIL